MASPTARRKLGIALKKLREQAGFNIKQAAGTVGISESHLSRLESGQVGVRQPSVRALLQLYKAAEDVSVELLQIAAETTKRNDKSWWQPFTTVISSKFATLIGFESEATSIKALGQTGMPGLLQTESYARAIFENGVSRLEPDEIETRIEIRKSRQAILDKPDPPATWFILDEAVLRRPVGGAKVMREQLLHLARVAERPNVDVQVIPFSVGAHAGFLGPLIILGFAEGEDVVYCETYAGDLYPASLAWYGDLFARLARDAASRTRSLDMIRSAAEEIAR